MSRAQTLRNDLCKDNNEHRGHDNTLHAAAEDRIGNDGERFIGDHVCEEERDEEEVAIFADGLDLVSVKFLLANS